MRGQLLSFLLDRELQGRDLSGSSSLSITVSGSSAGSQHRFEQVSLLKDYLPLSGLVQYCACFVPGPTSPFNSFISPTLNHFPLQVLFCLFLVLSFPSPFVPCLWLVVPPLHPHMLPASLVLHLSCLPMPKLHQGAQLGGVGARGLRHNQMSG